MHTPLILIVDDENRLRELIQRYLIQAGYRVAHAGDGLSALAQARTLRPDLIILDLMLPALDGFEVCRRLRTFSDAYILMLTAKVEEPDRVKGLEVGADDYLVKPFSPRELVARVRAMFRRPRQSGHIDEPSTMTVGPLTIDSESHTVRLDGVPINLTPLEYRLLTILAAAPGRVFSRAQLLDQVWGNNYFGDEHVLEVHIANLRKKLGDDPARPRFIFTVRSVGYRFGERT
ncbi:MAG: DNA-binding response regulator [Chloroflexus sp.]|nr:MAG: DNA-binding response regulator [Chloroflexus sp.]